MLIQYIKTTFGDYAINSDDLTQGVVNDIVRKSLMLVATETTIAGSLS